MNLGRETETLEFKKSTGELKEGVISIVAILNKHQKGELYFGIKSDGTPIGQEITDKTLRDISQAINNHIDPQIFPEIVTVQIDERECVLVRFEGYNTPYFAYNIARIRVADEDKVMSQQELVAYLRTQDNTEDAWERRVSGFTVDHVEDKRVKQYIERGRTAKRIEFEYENKEVSLNKLLLTDGKQLLNAGMVLFCESMYAELQLAIFAGIERLTFLDIQRQRGNIFELVALAEKYIMSNIRWGVKFNGSLQRKEIPEIPVEAIREALINSFCHKDYGACNSNEVAIYKDRVEIYNPGSFPKGYKPEDFISGGERPVRRNPLITSVLYYSKDVESFGTGLKRITDACKDAGCRYEFKIMKSGFVVVFYRRESTQYDTEHQNTGQDAVQDTVQDDVAGQDAGQDTVQDTVQDDVAVQDTVQDTVQDGVAGQDTVQDTVQDDVAGQDTVQDAVQDTVQDDVAGQDAGQDTGQDTGQDDDAGQDAGQDDDAGRVKAEALLKYCVMPRSRREMQEFCRLAGRNNFSRIYLKPLIESGRLRMTIPEKPNSRNQRYVAAMKPETQYKDR